MKQNHIFQSSLLLTCIVQFALGQNAEAQPFTTGSGILNSESIASNALRVAQQMNRTGRCYEGVCKAVKPLGVELTGEAAYQANDLLIQDKRFIPLVITDVSQLRRGDIIVYNKSQTHPYGHISVYEGNLTEASDHISAVTHTKNYGGATVFRLANEASYPSYANSYETQMNSPYVSYAPPVIPPPQRTISQPYIPAVAPNYKNTTTSSRNGRNYYSQPLLFRQVKRNILRRVMNYLLN